MQEAIDQLLAPYGLPEFVRRFEYSASGPVHFGAGVRAQLGEVAAEAGITRAILVTDSGIAATGYVDDGVKSLREAGIEVWVHREVRENPTTDDVDRCQRAAASFAADGIIGFGGGSSLDTAKGANFILTNGGEMKDYWGVGKATKPMLPLIAVPTTSGTGSECQSFALIADAETHAKMACGDKKAAAAAVLLDPELTETMPAVVSAHTGIDALAHALETLVCNKATERSRTYSRAAWRLIRDSFAEVLSATADEAAVKRSRALMQVGAALAGIAIEESMLGVAHSCANPLTAHYGIAHGQAVGVMLPHVLRFNRQHSVVAAEQYAALDEAHPAQVILDFLEQAQLATSLIDLDVPEEDLPMLSREAERQWTAQFNPAPVDAERLQSIYEAAFS